MTILLEKWLHHRVGYCVQLDPKDVGRSLYDGKVFFDLLKSYGILDIEMFGGIPGRGRKTPDEALRCLKQLSDAFCFLNIQVDDEYLRQIANRNGPLAIRLLSQLYLKLQNKNYLDLLDVENDDIFKRKTKKEVLAMCLKYRYKDLIGGDGARQMAKIKMFDNAARKVKENCEVESNRMKIQKPARPPSTITGELLTDMIFTEDGEFDFNAQDYIKSLKSAARQKKNQEHQLAKSVGVPAEIPTDVLSTMNNEFNSSLKESMNHQSHYEKYQAAKWSKAHHTLARFFEEGLYKYVDSDEEIDKEHVVQNKILREGGEAIAKQQEPTWILHRKIYAGRLKHRKRCNVEMCRHIVQDLVEVLMKVLLYRYEHKREPVPRKVMNDWKECFWKCQLTSPPDPIYEGSSIEGEVFISEDGEGVDGYLEDEEDYSEITLDQEIIRILHEYDLHCYLYEVGPWDFANWSDWKYDDENLMVSGFIVHRLLQTKYPLPKGYQDPKFDFKIRAAINPLKDHNSAYIYNTMRNLLTTQKVAVLDIIEPMNYCLTRYNEEISAIGELENALLAKEQAKETKPSAGRPSSLKKQRASKAGSGRKSMSRKSMGSKEGGAGKSEAKNKATGGARKSKMPGGARKSAAGGARKSAAGGARKSAAGGARKSAAGGARKSAAGGGKKPAAGAEKKPAAGARKSLGGKKSLAGKKKSLERGRSPGPRSKSGKRIFEKSVQCPSVDELVPRVNHSPAGLLGKEAFTALNEGRPVGDLLAGKMLVEFLKIKSEGMAGFALLSYPLTVSQAVLLEFLLTGRPVKTDYKVSAEVAKFIHDELRPQPYIDTRVLVDFEDIFQLNNIERIEGEANEVFQIDAGNLEDLQKAMEPVLQEEASVFNIREGPAEEGVQDYERETVKIVEYPFWDLKPHTLQFLTEEELKVRQKIKDHAYNIGRFRPYLSQEEYDKIKNHILCLISYLRSRKKHQSNPCNVIVQSPLINYDKAPPTEENEEESLSREETRAIFGTPTTCPKIEEYKRPVTYTQILKLRSSEILPRPNKNEMEIHYSTSSFFQKYVKCLPQDQAKKEDEEYQARKEKFDKIMNDELPAEENFVLDPILEENPDSFYKIYGTKLVCDYHKLDYDSITRICRMIIGEPWEDMDLERKRSFELFDIDTLQKLRKDLPGKKKASGSSKGKRKSKATRKSTSSGARKSKAGRKSSAGRRASKRQSKSPSKRQSMKRKSSAKQGGGKNSKSTATAGKVAGAKPGEKSSPPPDNTTTDQGQERIETSPELPLEGNAQTITMPQPELPLPPRPGELGWEYVQETIPDIYQIYLATTWESIEFEYLTNLKNAFCAMRTHDNKVIPYRDYVRQQMKRKLEMSDDRMGTVDLFQKHFNNVEQKAKNRADVKQSLHCRIFALYNDLVDIADDKRSKALARREELLKQQWVPKHLFTLANLYRNLIQTEANRTIQSLQLLHDYYYAMLQKPTCETRLQLLSIPKVFHPKIDESLSSDNVETDFKIGLPDEGSKNTETLENDINHIISSFAAKMDPDLTNPMIDGSITIAKGIINGLFDYYEMLILDPGLGKELRPKVLKKLTIEEEKARRKQEKEFRKMLERRKQVEIVDRTPSENRYSKSPKIKRKKEVKEIEHQDSAAINQRRSFHIDASKLQMVDKLKWEWLVAVQKEIARLHFRLDLIEKRGKGDFEEVLSIMKAVYNEFFHDVGWQYRREMNAIEEAINMFKAAADTEVGIPIQMNLGNTRFYLGKRENSDLFPEVPPPPNSPSHQMPPEFWLTMQQLSNFVRKIEDASPDGMLDGCLVEVLEDMVTYSKETNFEFLPRGWAELTRRDIEFLVDQTFGSKSLANWREFLLYCIEFEYPTLEEIIEMRIRFREADVYQCENVDYATFMRIPLWSEKVEASDDELLWNQELKDLLFKLFRTARKEINYTDLLLSLCKGQTPEEGLGKALALMDGFGYIFWPDPLDFVHPRHVVDYVLNQILHDVIIKADYITITEVYDEEYGENGEENEKELLIDENAELEEEDYGEEEENFVDKYKIIVWKTCVPYKTCQALLFAALRFSEHPASHLVRQLDVEARLKRLYDEKGVGTHLKAYKLSQSELMTDIFQKTCAFRECNIPEMVHSIVMSKHHTIGGVSNH